MRTMAAFWLGEERQMTTLLHCAPTCAHMQAHVRAQPHASMGPAQECFHCLEAAACESTHTRCGAHSVASEDIQAGIRVCFLLPTLT
jgi:hypothetical protein